MLRLAFAFGGLSSTLGTRTSAFCFLPSAFRVGLELYRSAPKNISLPRGEAVCYRAPSLKPERRRNHSQPNTPGGPPREENHGRIHLDRRTEADGETAVEDQDHRPGQDTRRHPRVGLRRIEH